LIGNRWIRFPSRVPLRTKKAEIARPFYPLAAALLRYSTFFISSPQGHLPGFWLMASHLQSGPQAQAYLPVVLNERAFFHESAFNITRPFSTFITFAFTISLPQVHLPGVLAMVWHGQSAPQLQA
jgi:hypothetical protein